jgi:hypothetical protein
MPHPSAVHDSGTDSYGALHRVPLILCGIVQHSTLWVLCQIRHSTQLRANLLTVIAEGDHITPPCQSEAVLANVGSNDKEVFRVPGGRIGIMAGNGAHKRTWPHIDAWLGERSK